ncbi:hypothetical protein JHK82_035684 [Glycine max]|nr:hypothetical protein JHK85_036410 [Glycine max]KAG4976344.1 hypothetical protein JHK86_035818 [Glycine max]KAG5112415.1 hypothetical protein JHK82_035684 [Glycine max]KAG5129692.1 hypothetical protein JHK84_036089 [Glycine max]
MDKPLIQTALVLDDSTDPAIKVNNFPAIMFPKDMILRIQVNFQVEKNLKQLEKLWKEMKTRRVAPNKGLIDRAMVGIMVSVFSKVGLVDELVKLLQDMKAEGTRLDQRLYQSASNAFKDVGLQIQARRNLPYRCSNTPDNSLQLNMRQNAAKWNLSFQ